MNPLRWLRRRRPSADAAEPSSSVRWIPAAENPFGVDLLDCSAFAQSTVSSTSSADVAARFGQLRVSGGEHCRGKEPPTPFAAECHLEYPSKQHGDGPIFLADQMEEKWDIYLFDGDLYFARSWTGDLAYKASVRFHDSKAVITKVSGQREPGTSENPVAVVDFLVKSHIYGLVAPHPLPDTSETSPEQLVLWSFSHFGRRGLYGTTSDVTHVPVVRGDDGRCILKLPNSQ